MEPNNMITAEIAILGCGAMGTAMLEGWLRNTAGPRFSLHVNSQHSLVRLQERIAGMNHEKRQKIELAEWGSKGILSAVAFARIIIMACPPDQLHALIAQPGLLNLMQGKTVVSILAGVSSSQIKEAVASSWASQVSHDMEPIHLVRAMPSLGASRGESVTMIAVNEENLTSEPQVDELFAQLGTIMHLPEIHMNRATALGAVCHALVLIAADTAGDASAAEGLPRPIAKELAAKCFKSCGGLLDQGMTPEQIKDAMAVPHGITINAVLNLEKGSRSNIAESVRSAIQYAERMA